MLTAARAGRPSGGGTEQVREFLMLLKLSSDYLSSEAPQRIMTTDMISFRT